MVSGQASDLRTCALCGDEVGNRWIVSALGENFCAAHETLATCRMCAAPAKVAPHCAACAGTVVDDQSRVRAVLPAIRADLHGLGIRLTNPVQVELVSRRMIGTLLAEPWDAAGPPTVSGLTISTGEKVLRLTVLEGMPLVEFGAVVAHEAMHAWMAQRGFGDDVPRHLSEGLCQLTAFSWLRRQRDPRAALLRDTMEDDPDPDYGVGFRLVRDAVLASGLKVVLATVRTHRRLP